MTSKSSQELALVAENLSKLKMGPTREETIGFRRLPTNVQPINYNIHFDPNWNSPEYTCIETIDLEVHSVTTVITLNAVNLKIVQITYDDGRETESSTAYPSFHTLDEVKETLIITFKKPIHPGKGKLMLVFTGVINEDWQGFFRFKDERSNNEIPKYGYTLATHFEPTYARRAFPCFDEPAIKASFEISVIVPIPLNVVSNMPQLSEGPSGPGKKIVRFFRSPPMSTYLVAFVIGEFEALKTECAGVICRIHTGIGKAQSAEFALRVVTKLLPFFNEYFGHLYPLPKLDIVALSEFPCGAMENWGLILYNESKVLIDVTVTSSRTKQTIAQTLAHELAHQWFGDLVTMSWWTDLWLKESLAHFLEFLALEEVCPEYSSWSQFTTNTIIQSLEMDALEGSHPIGAPIESPSQISESFDRLSYIKGSALIRMLHNFLTDKVFRLGLKLFMARYVLRSASAAEFWGVLEEASSKPIKAMMATWTNQKGFPLLKICFDQHEGNSRTMTITQEKFCAHPKFSEHKAQFDCFRWILPITFTSGQNPKETCFKLLMNGQTARIINFTIADVQKDDWVKINSGLQGYFRVHYPSETRAGFIPAIKAKTMLPLDRLSLLDDLFSMVKTGDVSTDQLLRFMRAYMKENDFNVWLAIDNIVGTLNILLSFTDLHAKFQNYAKREIFKDIEEQMGWEPIPGEGHVEGLLRVQILSRMVSLGSEKTIRQAKDRFRHRDKAPIHPDLRSVVYRAVLASASGSLEALNSLLQMYRGTTHQEEKLRILRALGSVQAPVLKKKVLEFAMGDEVKPNDVLAVILGMCVSKHGIEVAWNFFKEHQLEFKQRFPVGQIFARFIKILTWSFATEDMANEVEQFFNENEFEGIDQTISQAVENIHVNEEWIARDINFLRTYLTKV